MKKKLLQIYFQLLAKLAHRYLKRHKPLIIGVHGSVGKTSCRLITHQTLQHFFPNKIISTSPHNFNGELGMSLSIFQIEKNTPSILGVVQNLWIALYKLFFASRPYDIVVLEYGIDRPAEMDFLLDIARPHIGVCTKLDAVHSMQFGSPEAIAKEELKMLTKTLEAVFINESEPKAMDIRDQLSTDILTYQTDSHSTSADLQVTEKQLSRNDGKMHASIELDCRGKKCHIDTNMIDYIHYGYIATAVTIADLLHYRYYKEPLQNTQKLSLHYTLMGGRMNFFAGIHESVILDSTYNASPLSMQKTIELMHHLHKKIFTHYEIWFVLGDMRELGSESPIQHKKLAEILSSNPPAKLFLVGEDTKNYVLPYITSKHLPAQHIIQESNALTIASKLKTMLENTDKKVLMLCKGSQNTIFLEEVVKMLLADSKDSSHLCRQSPSRLKTKTKFFQP